MSLELFVRGLYTRTAVARHPCFSWGYRGSSPTAVWPSDPALCGSCPLVTPYYCRLGDLLCLFCVYRFLCALLSTYICIQLFSLSFVDLPSVL